jgi:predicted ester cyclase
MAESPAVASNIEIARDYTRRVFNGHHPDLAAEFVSPDVRWHGGTLGTVEGVENLVALLRGFIGALPDLNAQEQDIVAAGDTVALRFVVEATHEGELLGIAPTGRKVRWDAVDVYRFKDGKITEEWAADDLTAILHAVGAYTPPWVASRSRPRSDGRCRGRARARRTGCGRATQSTTRRGSLAG